MGNLAPAMTLKEYIDSHIMTQYDLAREIPCSQAMVSRIVNGRQKPSFRMAKRISQITSGLVPISNWFDTSEPDVIGE